MMRFVNRSFIAAFNVALVNIGFSILTVILTNVSSRGQIFPAANTYIEQLNLQGTLPEKLLSTKTVVFYAPDFSEKQLGDAQAYFQRSGIDAVTYFAMDMLTAGVDVTRAFHAFLTKREISNIIFLEKKENNFRISITAFNGHENIVEPKQAAWSVTHKQFDEALKVMFRATAVGLKRENLLINSAVEMGLTINPILGKRNDFFAVDLKVDPLAVPMFGDEALDTELEALMAANYPFKYKLIEPGTTEKDMRKQGYYYVVRFIHTRGSIAKELLGYNTDKTETALVSVTYPGEGQQLKNIPANTPVFKVYFKHIDSQNVFLGTKWDADLTWQQALLNGIRGLKTEMRIN